MRKTVIILCSILFCLKIFSQTEKKIIKDSIIKTKVSKNDCLDKITLNIGSGAFMPQGELKRYFNNAPLIEVSLNFPLNNHKSVDFVSQFIIPKQAEDFSYIRAIDTIQVKSKMMFNFFIKFKKSLITSNKFKFEPYLGLGISTITTDARNPFYTGAENENKFEFISSMLIAPGIDCVFKIKRNSDLRIGINYQYSPYKVDGALRQKIGNSAIIPRISFTF